MSDRLTFYAEHIAPRMAEWFEHRARESRPSCPACGGPLVERKGKTVCERCGRINEGCCEGSRG